MSAAEVSGILARLEVKTREMEAAGEVAVVRFAHTVAERAADLAPVEDERTRGDHPAGALRDSLRGGADGVAEDGVKVERDRFGPVAVIGSRLPYAAKIEYEDQAFLRVALHESEAEFHAKIRSAVAPVVGL